MKRYPSIYVLFKVQKGARIGAIYATVSLADSPVNLGGLKVFSIALADFYSKTVTIVIKSLIRILRQYKVFFQ